MTTLMQVPVLYCDIDGTIRKGYGELGHFVNTPDQVEVFPEVPKLLKGYKDLGWRIVGVSNQGGVALGHLSMDDCFAAMGETQRQCGMAFDKIVFCTHNPYDNPPCPCRKPGIAMIMETRDWLFQQHGETYPMHMGLFTGDRPEDETCAANAGLPFMWAKEWRDGKHINQVLSDPAYWLKRKPTDQRTIEPGSSAYRPEEN